MKKHYPIAQAFCWMEVIMASSQALKVGSTNQARDLNGCREHSCSRCGGLIVSESLLDFFNEGGERRCWGLRCIACGDIVDPVIIHNRNCEELPNPTPLKRRRWSTRRVIS